LGVVGGGSYQQLHDLALWTTVKQLLITILKLHFDQNQNAQNYRILGTFGGGIFTNKLMTQIECDGDRATRLHQCYMHEIRGMHINERE
jgi:ABC-type phosphate/phosphonate transport system permease subunit